MNWTVFGIFAYLFLAMQQGLAGLFAISTGSGSVGPRFELILATFIGLFAPGRVTLVAWGLLGLAADLLNVSHDGTIVIGPYTLGFLAGGVTVLQVRLLVLRTHPLSHGFAVFCSGIAVALVVVINLTVRGWWYGQPDGYGALNDLLNRSMGALYTCLLAVLLTWPLMKATPLLGLPLSRNARR